MENSVAEMLPGAVEIVKTKILSQNTIDAD